MLKKIEPVEWLVLTLALMFAKVFFLPQTELMEILANVATAACGIGAVVSINAEEVSLAAADDEGINA